MRLLSACASSMSLGCCVELVAMHGPNRVRAGTHQLARPAQRLLAGRVLPIELSARPALDAIQVEAHSSTISMRLLPLPLFSEPVMRTRPDLARVGDVRAAIGLLIDAFDVDHANGLDAVRAAG